MVDIAQHIRIFDTKPADDLIKKRTAAIKDIAAKLTSPKSVGELFKVANDVVTAARFDKKLPEGLAEEATAAIKKHSLAFVKAGSAIELSTCLLLAAVTALQSGATQGNLNRLDFLAVGIWLGLSMQPACKEGRIEALRSELLQSARGFTLDAARNARKRVAPPTIPVLKAENANLAEVITGLRNAIDRVNVNAVMDREEIDFLWWSVSSWSDALGRQYSEAGPYTAAIAFGIDGAKRLRRMPLELHRELVLRRLPKAEPMTLPDLIKALGVDRSELGNHVPQGSEATSNPDVFPLTSSLLSGSANKAVSKELLSIADWTSRMMLECVALGVISRGGV